MIAPTLPRLGASLGLLLAICAPASFGMQGAEVERSADPLAWADLPPLPDTPGVGGGFVGRHGEALVVAGGANFPAAPPWEGGAKVWHADVHVLVAGEEAWRSAAPLPRPLAYGGAVSAPEGMVLLGGMDAERAYADVLRLVWDPAEGTLRQEHLPPLPRPSAFVGAALVGQTIFVAAGQQSADATALDHAVWSLDLGVAGEARRWESREPWPGPARVKAVAAAQALGDGRPAFLLFSGEVPERDSTGALAYTYLRDAFAFDPDAREGRGSWRRCADLPAPAAAACAAPLGQAHVLVFSGSTGEHVGQPLDTQPDFPARVLAYHTITDTWVHASDLPQPVVTTGAVWWDDRIVLASGERRPGVRTPRVQAARPVAAGPRFGVLNTAVLSAYLLVLVGMGARFARREEGTRDFFLAGGRIPWWAAGLSIYATQLSAITFLATPALAFATDWRVVPGTIMMLLIVPVIVGCYLPFFRRLELTTAYEYLEQRFGLTVRLVGSASFVAFQLGRMAVVVYLPAMALAAVTGIEVHLCILLMGVLATLYTVLGGMEAVVWTDVVQTLVLLCGVLVVLGIAVVETGGPGAVLAAAQEADKLRWADWTLDPTARSTGAVLLGSLLLVLGPYTTDQAVIQRYLSTQDERSAARGIWLNGLLSVPGAALFFLVGTVLFAFFKHRPELLAVGMKSDEVLPLFVASRLPAGLSGLVIAGVFAAAMSSLDSSVHSISTAVTNDGFRRLGRPRSDHQYLVLARILTVVIGALGTGVALVLATYDIDSLYLFFQGLLGLLSSGLVGMFVLGIFTRRSHSAGVLVGAVVSFGLLTWVSRSSAIDLYLYPVVGIGSAVGVGYLASLVLPGGGRDLAGLTWAGLRAGERPTPRQAAAARTEEVPS